LENGASFDGDVIENQQFIAAGMEDDLGMSNKKH
jgi:hypothetical protein